MEPGTSGDNSAEPTKGPKAADGSQDCSCAEARAHLEAFLDRECTADLAEREGNFEEAGRLRYGDMPALERQIREAEAAADAGELLEPPGAQGREDLALVRDRGRQDVVVGADAVRGDHEEHVLPTPRAVGGGGVDVPDLAAGAVLPPGDGGRQGAGC